MRESSLSSTSLPDEEKMLQDLKRRQQKKIIYNNFTLLIILNIINYILFIFSCSFYMWYQLQIVLQPQNTFQISTNQAHQGNTRINSVGNNGQEYKIWLNMLYVFNERGDQGSHYMTFGSYKGSSFFICNQMENEDFCSDKFDQMSIIGYTCFSLLMLGIVLQATDLYRLVRLRATDGKRSGFKAFWLHPSIISLYTAGFLTYFFTVLFFQLADEEIIFDMRSFGVSFWIGVGSIPIYVVLAFYYRKTKNKLKSQELLDDLINRIDNFQQSQRQKNNDDKYSSQTSMRDQE